MGSLVCSCYVVDPTPVSAVTATATCAASAGTNWTNPTNILSNADSDAYASYTNSARDLLNVTTCTFSPTVPDGSTITGIQVRHIGCGTGGTSAARQIDIGLLNLGTCTAKTGVNQAACPTWTDTTQGGTSDTWSCTGAQWASGLVSTSNLNSTSFGATVRDNNTTATELRSQYLEITLTFTTTSTTTTTIVGSATPPRRML